MKALYFIAPLVLLILVGCEPEDEKELQKNIIGYWQLQISEKENIGLEMQFKEQGKMHVRVVDPTYIETKILKEYPGIYQIKGNKISYNIVFSEKFKQEPKMENQYIEIKGSSMFLKPVEFDGKVINKYKKIDTWTLRL